MPDKNYKQIVILSGKGGTGKTTVASAFSKMLKEKATIDCDVDAANLHLILNPENCKKFEYYGGKKAEIDLDKCSRCGICESVCRFDAIKNYQVSKLSCEGCGFCFNVCPEKAINFSEFKSGRYYECNLSDESKFYYANLYPGEGNSGKLVSEIKQQALEKTNGNTKWIIIDGPPGIGCPVNASLSGADFVVIVTEPTQSGIHDLKRLVELLKTFSIRYGIIINKFDLNKDVTDQIAKYAGEQNFPILGYLPFDEEYVHAIQHNKSVVEINSYTSKLFENIWSRVKNFLDVVQN